jgi:tRNA pseudouridine55 synthase
VVQAGRKTYEAEVQLGIATETDDSEGDVVEERPVPPLTPSLLEDTLASFTGDILQTPPKYSALKVAGRRAYALARAGEEPRLAPRPVTIDELRLLKCTTTTLTIEVTCSRGTYIRALARDIAARLDTVGHMSALTRTRVGPFQISEALTVEEIADRGVSATLLSPRCALPEAPTLTHSSSKDARRFRDGQPIPLAAGLRAERVWVYDPDGHLLGLAAADGQLLRPRLAL